MPNPLLERFHRWRNDPERRLRRHFAERFRVVAVRLANTRPAREEFPGLCRGRPEFAWQHVPRSAESIADLLGRTGQEVADLVYVAENDDLPEPLRCITEHPRPPEVLMVQVGKIPFSDRTDAMNLLTREYRVEDLDRFWFCIKEPS